MHTAPENQHDIGQLLERHPAIKVEIDSLKGTIHGLKQYILHLEEFIRHGRQKQFGASSEQIADPHPSLFDEAENDACADEAQEAETVAEPGSKPARKQRKAFRIPPDLPRMGIVHDLPDAQKACPNDGTALRVPIVQRRKLPSQRQLSSASAWNSCSDRMAKRTQRVLLATR